MFLCSLKVRLPMTLTWSCPSSHLFNLSLFEVFFLFMLPTSMILGFSSLKSNGEHLEVYPEAKEMAESVNISETLPVHEAQLKCNDSSIHSLFQILRNQLEFFVHETHMQHTLLEPLHKVPFPGPLGKSLRAGPTF